ncbi:MAG TPA: efflux RND transporter periplasmic adaptor subunit [Pontiellaceae bacterium]|nr:efflux RND transporter periplasmic adaptor subunit [Pontiellaceae bacterium]HPR82684.1 efflux RND transporter periplasmic adaptor subunit [Pontiellaceae bacterium]
MKKPLFILAALLIGGAAAVLPPAGCGRNSAGHPAGKTIQYHCPMHPAVVSDQPGDCPICGMKLVLMEQEKQPGAAAAPSVPGLTAVSILPEARQRMGLVLGTVERRMLTRNIRTSARIVADETRLFRVTTKVEGWVDKLFVATTGQAVRPGDPLLTIYSPQLVSAQQEYLSAVQSAGWLKDSARQRLRLWDVSDEQIDRLEKTGQVEKTLTLYAPSGGFVTEKTVLAGQKILPGDPLLVVADLSVVWGDADIYESDLPYVQVGMPMELALPYWPGKTFSGKVSFVSPVLDRETRTLKIRLEIPNPDALLKLEMYGDAVLRFSLGEKLTAPESAIMKTGERTYAFRDDGAGKLVPVEVKTGVRSDGYYEVLAGLNEGDRVVTAANFLVDSESSMRAALDALSGK